MHSPGTPSRFSYLIARLLAAVQGLSLGGLFREPWSFRLPLGWPPPRLDNMGWRSFLKQQLREGKGASKALLIGGGSTELELNKHFRLVRKLGKGNYATV